MFLAKLNTLSNVHNVHNVHTLGGVNVVNIVNFIKSFSLELKYPRDYFQLAVNSISSGLIFY